MNINRVAVMHVTHQSFLIGAGKLRTRKLIQPGLKDKGLRDQSFEGFVDK